MTEGIVTLRPPNGSPRIMCTYTGPFVIQGAGVWVKDSVGTSTPTTVRAALGNPLTVANGWIYVPMAQVMAISAEQQPDG